MHLHQQEMLANSQLPLLFQQLVKGQLEKDLEKLFLFVATHEM